MTFRPLLTASLISLTLAMSACSPGPKPEVSKAELVEAESQKLNDWFEARFEEGLERSPMSKTYLGMSDDSTGRLDDASQAALDEDAALLAAWVAEMRRTFDVDRLDPQTRLSYRLSEFDTADQLATHAWSGHNYVFQHMSGPHTSLPSFMINFHQVTDVKSAEQYITRLEGFENYLGAHAQRADKQFSEGVGLPKWVYPKLMSASENVIKGAPFTDGEDSPLWADAQKKINALEVSQEEKDRLLSAANEALVNRVQPAYQNLISVFEQHELRADDDDGVWKLPRGDEFYQARLQHYTTTDMTADEIHEIGLKDVERIHGEMRKIMERVGFEGTLQEFFNHLRTDPQFTYDNNDEGRQRYIDEATAMIDDMRERLDELFITKPKADLIVKRVEPFREDTAFGAFYNRPATDGSRPGTYYINLKDMGELPIYQMQALAYHEGIPGHHMQLAISQELGDLPKFRTLGGHTAYIEGWALYSEGVPKELGMYTDPYQEFGQLSMEIFRSARLVVDTGIHSKKWTREQAVDYFMANTANSEGDIKAEIDRYIVWPGQATAYKVGMIKIGQLRADAESRLGDKFDVREFHDVILANGSVPLKVLEELVNEWVEGKG